MKLVLLISIILSCTLPVSATELTAPAVPDSGTQYMPKDIESFESALWRMVRDASSQIYPDLSEACAICFSVIVVVLLIAIVNQVPGGAYAPVNLIGSAAVSVILLSSANTLIHLGTHTIRQLSEYGRLLLPVMTSALAAQGHITSSSTLYTGTIIFDSVLTNAISSLLIPIVYLYLFTSIAGSIVTEEIIEKLSKFLKWIIVWSLKTILYIFTGYIGVTGVISGSADAAALKATKLTISGFVPVVGGILADASEAVLVGAGVVKNAAGIYGILAIIAVFIGPFIKLGTHYLLLKTTAAISCIAYNKQITGLIDQFSSAMGLVLAMTGSVCLLLLISTVCFIKGVG